MSSEPLDQPTGLGDRLDDLLLKAEALVARSRTTATAIGLIVAIAAGLWWWLVTPPNDSPVEDSIPLAGAGTAPPSTSTPPSTAVVGASPGQPGAGAGPSGDGAVPVTLEPFVVHVVGAVRRPGLVTVVAGARISDAVSAAGGARHDADLARLNLASLLIDGMQIRVPVFEDGRPEDEPLVRLPAVGDGSGGGGQTERTGPVDLNRASESELQTLPGIGPALAARIVAWRVENGGFASIDELEAVPGIGPTTLAELRDLVAV